MFEPSGLLFLQTNQVVQVADAVPKYTIQYHDILYNYTKFKIYQFKTAVTLSRIDSRIYGVSRYEMYVTRTSYIREHT